MIDQSLVSVICAIGYDHTQILGDTLQKIAFEKCGIYGDITKYFESLHTMGDHCIVQDIDDYISSITGNGLGKA